MIAGTVHERPLARAPLDHADGSPFRLGCEIDPVSRCHMRHEQILCIHVTSAAAAPASVRTTRGAAQSTDSAQDDRQRHALGWRVIGIRRSAQATASLAVSETMQNSSWQRSPAADTLALRAPPAANCASSIRHAPFILVVPDRMGIAPLGIKPTNRQLLDGFGRR